MVNSRQKGARSENGQFNCIGNEWEVHKTKDGDIYHCYLNGKLLFFTDDPRVVEHSWSKLADGYASSQINGNQVSAHRFISEPTDDELVDHINRNKKDNRKSNLRNTNKSLNAFNAKTRTNNTSGIAGVWYRNDTKKWTAEIKKDYKKYTLGSFETKKEAVAARQAAERVLYGEQSAKGKTC